MEKYYKSGKKFGYFFYFCRNKQNISTNSSPPGGPFRKIILPPMTPDNRLDETDLKILRTLQDNARITTKELAARVNLSTTPVFERLKRLEREGYIKKYVAILDAEKLNQGFLVFCSVKLKQMSRDVANDFVKVIQNVPQVTACYNVAGEFDYLLTINAPNMRYYNDFVINTLGTIESIGSILSTFVMKEIKQNHGFYL